MAEWQLLSPCDHATEASHVGQSAFHGPQSGGGASAMTRKDPYEGRHLGSARRQTGLWSPEGRVGRQGAKPKGGPHTPGENSRRSPPAGLCGEFSFPRFSHPVLAVHDHGIVKKPSVIVWFPPASMANTSNPCSPEPRDATYSGGTVTAVAVPGRVT